MSRQLQPLENPQADLFDQPDSLKCLNVTTLLNYNGSKLLRGNFKRDY